MKTELYIAKRYFFSKKKKNFINILTNISMISVCVSSMALIVVLSVFNGLENLTRALHSAYNPELKVSLVKGKSFEWTEELKKKVYATEGVAQVTEIIEDNALIRYGDAQMAVVAKGVSSNFNKQYDISDKLVSGQFILEDSSVNYALLGMGVQMQLNTDLHESINPLVFWYPKRNKRLGADPLKSFNEIPIMPGGVLSIEQKFDQSSVLVPLRFAQNLMELDGRLTGLEIRASSPEMIPDVKEALSATLGSNFKVLDSDEQQEAVLRAFRIERLFVFIVCAFVLSIASFNIFCSLAMLSIEKKADMALLKALGMSQQMAGRIFLAEGAMIAFSGAIIGLLLGTLLCWIQQQFGIVGIGIETSIVNAYPVEMHVSDYIYTSITIIVITLGASIFPAWQTAKAPLSGNLSR